MTNLLLQHGVWQLTKLSKKLGIIGGLGAALVLGCGMLYLSHFTALNQQISEARHALQDAPLTQDVTFTAKQLPAKNTADTLEEFKLLLPQAASLHDHLSLIDETAQKNKLILNRGDYKYSKTKQSQISDGFYLSSYEIVLPVSGQYLQIRQFIAQVLHLQPALALSDLKMTRDNSLSPNIDVKMVFVLYLKSELK